MPRRLGGGALVRALAAVCALLVGTASVASADPGQAVPTISARAEVAADFSVSVSGQVTVDGGKVNNIGIRGSLAGREAAVGTTDGNGAFTLTFVLPTDLRSSPQSLVISTDARGKLAAASVTIPLAGVAPTSIAPPRKMKVKLTAEVDKADVSPGSLITVEGRLTTTSGAPVSSAEIDLLLDRDLLDESTTITDDRGAFSTFFEMPLGEPEGNPRLRIRFSGSDELDAARKDIVLTVTIDSPEPSPTATTSASPTAPFTTEASKLAGQSASPSASASTGSTANADATPATPPATNPWAWFLAGLVGVGGTTLLIAGFLVFRGWRARRGDEEETLHLLSDPDSDDFEDPVLPEEGALLSDEVGEEVDADYVEDFPDSGFIDGPEEPPAVPRRGI